MCVLLDSAQALATSSVSAAVALKRLRHEPMFAHFEVIVCGDDPLVQVGKPAPDIFLEAARRLGVVRDVCCTSKCICVLSSWCCAETLILAIYMYI